MTRHPAGILAVVLTGLLLLGGCGGEEVADVRDPRPDPTALLEQARADVRARAARLLTTAEESPGGTVTAESGRYEGCTSRAPEGYRDVRYVAEARLDLDGVAGAAAPYVDALAPALAHVGLAGQAEPTTAPNGFVRLTGRSDDLTSTVTWTGAGPFVLLRVEGPCVEVGADEWSAWTDRAADATLR